MAGSGGTGDFTMNGLGELLPGTSSVNLSFRIPKLHFSVGGGSSSLYWSKELAELSDSCFVLPNNFHLVCLRAGLASSPTLFSLAVLVSMVRVGPPPL